jgi:hypothetical protein
MVQAPDRVLGLDPAVPAVRVAPDPVALRPQLPVVPEVRAVQHLVGQVDPAELTDLVVRADPHRVDLVEPRPLAPVELRLVDLALMGLPDRAAPVDLVARVDLDPAGLAVPRDTDPAGLPDRAAPVDLVARVDLDLAGLAVPRDTDPAGLAVPRDTDPAAPAARVDLDLAALAVPRDTVRVALVVPVDHRRRLMCSMAPSIAVARNSAVLETHRTASAHPIMVPRRRPHSTGSVGTAGPLPVGLRRTGMGRLLPVAGTVRRLPVVGTRAGTVLAAT